MMTPSKTSTSTAPDERQLDFKAGDNFARAGSKYEENYIKECLRRLSLDFPRLPLSVLERALKVKSWRPTSTNKSVTSCCRRADYPETAQDSDYVDTTVEREGMAAEFLVSPRIQLLRSNISSQTFDKSHMDFTQEMMKPPEPQEVPSSSNDNVLSRDNKTDELLAIVNNEFINRNYDESCTGDMVRCREEHAYPFECLHHLSEELTEGHMLNLDEDSLRTSTDRCNERINMSDMNFILADFPATVNTSISAKQGKRADTEPAGCDGQGPKWKRSSSDRGSIDGRCRITRPALDVENDEVRSIYRGTQLGHGDERSFSGSGNKRSISARGKIPVAWKLPKSKHGRRQDEYHEIHMPSVEEVGLLEARPRGENYMQHTFIVDAFGDEVTPRTLKSLNENHGETDCASLKEVHDSLQVSVGDETSRERRRSLTQPEAPPATPNNEEEDQESSAQAQPLPQFKPTKIECSVCRGQILKFGGCHRLTCICGQSVCYMCRLGLPPKSRYEHFCQHERYHEKSPCELCTLCDLYELPAEDKANEQREANVEEKGERAVKEWMEWSGLQVAGLLRVTQ